MPAYKLTIAYDGTDYCGFQVQPNGPTIQGLLMKAAIDLFGPDVTVTGASRTDSGVHARGQVVLLKADKAIEPRKVPLALNMRLPRDIVVVGAEEVDDDWHPRYVKHNKTYSYKIYNGSFHFPQDYRDSYHYYRKLDVQKMQEAGQLLVGTHDFESYSSARKSVEETVRTIYRLEVTEENEMIQVVVTGNGFLYNMVRIIVGTLMEVGYGRRTLEAIEESVTKRDRSLTGKTAPAKGLTLLEISYDKKSDK